METLAMIGQAFKEESMSSCFNGVFRLSETKKGETDE
jgi:hypothetical protein